MYRLTLYFLIFLLCVAVPLSLMGLLPFDPISLSFSVAFLLAVCGITNWIFAKGFGVPANLESPYISALILALVITPVHSTHDLWFLGWAAILAMASKYILAVHGRHIFNPVALALALTYLAINQSASWWVGSAPMLPFVGLGGLIVLRKIARFDLVISFLSATVIVTLALGWLTGVDAAKSLQNMLFSSPLIFFACIILTEPSSTPPTRRWRVVYAALTGILLSPQFHVAAFYPTPEIAMVIGDVFSFLVSPRMTLSLTLKEKTRIGSNIYDFFFIPQARRPLTFAPGQFMEWTLGNTHADRRGNRRYFTLASAPTEKHLRLGVKFYPSSSTFKRALLDMKKGDEIYASQLDGEFVLPRNPRAKCVFMAGGIGITPFRSMIQYLLDRGQRRPITLFYTNRSADEIIYRDVFEKAERVLGIRTFYTLTDSRKVPPSWKGEIGRINAQMVKHYVPDYQDHVFYLSGSRETVNAFKRLLKELGVQNPQIKTDYFPGLA